MSVNYAEIFQQSIDFQRAVNLSFDQGSLRLVEQYIPTIASASIIERFLKAVLQPGSDRASILIGPYGKGKSHTLFVVLSVLSEDGEEADAVFENLSARIANVNAEAAKLIRHVRNEKFRLLPVIINDRYLDVRQAFLASLRTALATANLSEMMPDNYFKQCLATIARWRTAFPTTYEAYVAYLKSIGQNATDFETRLQQYDAQSLTVFGVCHQAILSGTVFDPLLESDVPTLYHHVVETLHAHSAFSGVFIVFDEFGKYLESASTNANRFKVLQDLAELCSRSTATQPMLLSCISHKAISEYASSLNQVQQSSFRTIEGRFEPIYFTSTFEGSFSLISGALGRRKDRYEAFIANHPSQQAATIAQCDKLGCFAGYQSSVAEIVNLCFPMHPLTALSLMKLSEQAAQNERTLFTFLSDIDSPLTAFIHENKGEYSLATVPMVYDYFHIALRENSYDKELRSEIIHADSLLSILPLDEAALVKAIVLFSMVADNCLLPIEQNLVTALQWSQSQFDAAKQHLEQGHHIYTRRSDGVICLLQSTTENIRRDIEQEVLRRNRIDLAEQLSFIRDPGYTIPRRYNDRFEMVRYFQNVFVSTEQFTKRKNANFPKDCGFADGYVLYLLGDMDVKVVQEQLKRWADPKVVVLQPTLAFDDQESVAECAAIKCLLEHPVDEVAAEELSYYYEDMLQLIDESFAASFGQSAILVTAEAAKPCANIGTEISILCEEVLYAQAPVICHEMINRSIISKQMKQSRSKVIDAVLENEDFLQAFPLKSAEGPIMHAVLGHLQSEKMRELLEVIRNYVSTCEEGKKPLEPLYQQLMQTPYGIRKGVIPMLLAYVLKAKHRSTVLYHQGQELSINGESMNAIDEHYTDYELMVDRGSADQIAYLQALHDQYTPTDSVVNVRSIYDAVCKIVRSLPRAARANRKTMANGQVIDVLSSYVDIRNLLVRFDNNPRDVLIGKVPQKCGYTCACEPCARTIEAALHELTEYTNRLANGMKAIVRKHLNATTGQSIHGTMTIWLQRQPASRLNHSFNNTTTALLNVFRNQENHSDNEWINEIAVALTGLPIEDWSDKQVEDFESLLEAALSEIDSVQDDAVPLATQSHLQVCVGGQILEQFLPEQGLEGLANVAYQSVRSALNEFGDSLSTDEKLLLLANLMLHMNE